MTYLRSLWLVCLAALPALSLAAAPAESGVDGTVIYVADQLLHDDNLFRLSDAVIDSGGGIGGRSVDDLVNRASLGVLGNWTLGQQVVRADVRVSDNRFSENDYLNNVSGDGSLTLDWRLGGRLSGQAGAQYNRALAGFANTSFLDKDTLQTRAYFGSGRYRIGPHWFLTASGRRSETSHSAVQRLLDDYEANAGTGGIEYETRAGNIFGGEYRYTKAELSGLDRDYDENTSSVHIKYSLTAKTSLNASAGRLQRNYPNSAIGDFSGNVLRAALAWRPGAKTEVLLSGWRDLRANVDAESDYFVSRGVSLAPTWSPTQKIALQLRGSWEDQQYIGSNPITASALRHDDVTAVSFTGLYTPIAALQFTGAYRFEKRNSNRNQFEYDDNILSVGIRLSWQ